MSNYYAWGRRKGDTEWEKVAMIDCGRDGYQAVGKLWSMSEKDVEIKGPVETPEKTLNYAQMLEDILLLVESDFCENMELTAWDAENGKAKFKRSESIKMAHIIARIYGIAHCIHCEACQRKYLK